ncbi:hypothetical protein ACOKFD_17925 [Flagellimonas sp. S174]|uniref:hypothetical protein n=1 Tax=Flagellimonas sp. S174 TaxID=3410790 RepID=UPI003BF578C4
MNEKKNTLKHLDDLIESVSDIESVGAPPFFKNKVLSKLGKLDDQENVLTVLNWFNPKLQIAALLAFVFLNLGVLYYYNSSYQKEKMQTFAEAYGLSSTQEDSILN